MSFQKQTVLGNLGKDPALRYLDDGTPVATFTLAVNERRDEDPTWFQINVFGKAAEAAAEHLRRGDQAYVEGRLKAEMWPGRDGEMRQTLNINTSGYGVQFLGKRNPAAERDSAAGEGETAAAGEGAGQDDVDKDIPF